jgi:hypothetical protein
MEILPLLRKHLKDDAIIEILEQMDARIVYDFDRSHENIPDVYWAEAKDHGITMRFDANQRLDTVFVYVRPTEEHQPADLALLADVTAFSSASDVEAYAIGHGTHFKIGSRPAALPPPSNWVRLDYGNHRVHYEFREGELHIITISSAIEPQAASPGTGTSEP